MSFSGTRRLLVALVAVLAASFAVSALAAPARADTPTYPTLGWPPIGANDWSCRPTAAHPEPVVLVHGTFGDQKSLLDRLSATIKSKGYCVYALDYGSRATGPIEDSAQQLSTFVDRVLASTGAAKVDLVGHSQGGMMPRYYLRFLGGSTKVDDLVGMAPSNHGTTNPAAMNPLVGVFCRSCQQQAAGSAFLAHLNAGDETPGPISYTVVETRYDEVVTPYTSAFLTGDDTTNVTLQDVCPTDLTEHLNIPQDGPTIRIVLDALGRPGPADPSYRPSCLP